MLQLSTLLAMLMEMPMNSSSPPLIILIAWLFMLAAWSTLLERRVLSFWQVTKHIQLSLNNLDGECND